MMLLCIAAGGATGAVARYGVNVGVTRLLGHGFPYGTLTANILGSLLMGVCITLFARLLPVSEDMRALIVVGFLGSFTTFSTFSLDVVSLFQRGNMMLVLAYILGSVFCSVMAVVLGMALARQFAGA